MESPAEHVYSPSELNREVRLHIEMGFPRLLLEGEVSNLSRPTSGHLYFTLKDDRAQIRCALFRSAAGRSSVRLENGRLVLARGRLSLYEPRGDFQLIVDSVQEAGEGALQRRFEELKAKLEAEGLFDPGHKQPHLTSGGCRAGPAAHSRAPLAGGPGTALPRARAGQ
jgi:exodeoxyribonuclease VII large subunit